jgi:hypothetical protein
MRLRHAQVLVCWSIFAFFRRSRRKPRSSGLAIGSAVLSNGRFAFFALAIIRRRCPNRLLKRTVEPSALFQPAARRRLAQTLNGSSRAIHSPKPTSASGWVATAAPSDSSPKSRH